MLALLNLIASPLVIIRTATERITTQYGRVLTTTVDNMQHIESTTVNGLAMGEDLSCGRMRHLDTANAQGIRRLPDGHARGLTARFASTLRRSGWATPGRGPATPGRRRDAEPRREVDELGHGPGLHLLHQVPTLFLDGHLAGAELSGVGCAHA